MEKTGRKATGREKVFEERLPEFTLKKKKKNSIVRMQAVTLDVIMSAWWL